MNMCAVILDRIGIIGPIGPFDAQSVPETQKAIEDWLAEGISAIVVDLVAVSFIDSAAIALLVHGMNSCRNSGGDLVLCGPRPPVRIILELTQIDQAFHIYRDAGVACNALLYEPANLSA